MKTIIVFLALSTFAFAAPAKKITNREFPDRSGSSKEIDPDKRQSIETFYDQSRKPTYKIVYKLDERLQPISGIYYNGAGVVFQKSTYKLDGADRIIQEVVYNSKDRLVCTKNFIYGTRAGQTKVIGIDTYDSNGVLIRPQQSGGKKR